MTHKILIAAALTLTVAGCQMNKDHMMADDAMKSGDAMMADDAMKSGDAMMADDAMKSGDAMMADG